MFPVRSKSKYNNKKIVVDGITFDSQKEAMRYGQLKLLERAGEISDLKLQVPFELLPNQYETIERFSKGGKRLKDGLKLVERGVTYVADFTYNTGGKIVVEDVKSKATRKKESYIIKRKLMRYLKGIAIKEV